jgi:beta-N-acetylhexosaminidase
VLIDQEGGRVQRMGPPHWRPYPAAARFAATSAPERAAWLAARLIAADLLEAGINVDCAPVLDVAGEGMHAAIGARAFSDSAEKVATLGRAYANGLIAGGVAPVIKHMPGHGRAQVDSHLDLPVVTASREALAARDFTPFAALSDLPMAMSAHIVFTAIDDRAPATTSARVVSEIMRGAIGFDGLIFSDDTSMKALKGTFAEKTRAIFAAGLDVVLHCNGDLTEAREVVAETPELKGEALRRAEAALTCVAGGPQAFDAAAGRDELEALLATAPA